MQNPVSAIVAKNLSKQYVLGGAEQRYGNFRELITGAISAPFKKFRKLSGENLVDHFWALNEINFEVPQGQITGIIGRNGAGKSTLLKVLSRITPPTRGEVTMRGRVASLLEVGSGFHPELTGRENIYMNASILGMSHNDVHRKLDQIVEFAEVEKFIDTPVKRYSSGMYVRLAFSVAAHVDPDVLLVDEVLAVGDAKFQQRCIGKLSEVGEQGRTVMFVSHNMGLIQKLCTHSIYLKGGEMVDYGATKEVLGQYLTDGAETQGRWVSQDKDQTLRSVSLLNSDQQMVQSIGYREPLQVRMEFIAKRADSDYVLAVRVTDELGRDVFTSWDQDGIQRQTRIGEAYSVDCFLPQGLLRPGQYYLTAMVRNTEHSYLKNVEEVGLQFEVSNIEFPMNINRYGVVAPTLRWKMSSR